MQKTIAFRIFVFVVATMLIGIILASVLTQGFTNNDPFGLFLEKPTNSTGIYDQKGNEISTDNTQSLPTQMNFTARSFEIALANGQEYIEVPLTATVLPTTATNKQVDWLVGWSDGSDNANIDEYLTVTTTNVDGTSVVVRAYQPFDKDISITVITREGLFRATCVARYVGNAKSLVLANAGNCPIENGTYQIGAGESFTFEFKGIDGFGQETDNIDLGYDDSTSRSTYFYVADYVNTSSTAYWTDVHTKSLNEFSSICYEVTVDGKYLTITGKKGLEESYTNYVQNTQMRQFIYEDRFIFRTPVGMNEDATEGVTHNENLLASGVNFQLHLNNTLSSGTVYTFNFIINADSKVVNGVQLSQDTIEY